MRPCIRGHKITSDELDISPAKNGHKSFSETRPSTLTSVTVEYEMDETLKERPRTPWSFTFFGPRFVIYIREKDQHNYSMVVHGSTVEHN